MRHLTLSDLALGFRDLFDQRFADLHLSQSGKLYAPMLAQRRAAIEALPGALTGGRPLATELGQVDEHHDGFGSAIFAYTEALLRAPDTTADVRAAAQRIRDAFIPHKGTLQESYADEAAMAKKNRPALAERKADLESIPLPSGKTLYTWAEAFLDAGDTLDKLLSHRTLIEADASGNENAGQLRGSTIGLLNRFRSALGDELLLDAALPKNLDARVFGYFDELDARRKGARARSDDDSTPKGP